MCMIQDSFADCSAVGTSQRDKPMTREKSLISGKGSPCIDVVLWQHGERRR